MCNTLEGGVRGADILGTSLLVENISSCTPESRLRDDSEACKNDCLCTSYDRTTLVVDIRNRTDKNSDHLLERNILHKQCGDPATSV